MENFRDYRKRLQRRWEYRLIPTSNGATLPLDEDYAKRDRFCTRAVWRRSSCRFLSLVLALILLPVWMFSGVELPPVEPLTGEKATTYHKMHTHPTTDLDLSTNGRRLVIIVPSNRAHDDLCKTMSTAIALGYPTPIIVNWGVDFGKLPYGSHLGKITGALGYLESAMKSTANQGDALREDDLVLLVDALDVWFQLPPSVLIERYHESNRKANERLRKMWDESEAVAGTPMPTEMKQTILISSQKKCWPHKKDGYELHCDDLPESPLRDDLYGPETANYTEGMNDKLLRKVRPKFINSGSIMGPAGDMKRYFSAVKGVMDDRLSNLQGMTALHSDQGMFGQVLGAQEIWRQHMRDGINDTALLEQAGENEAYRHIDREVEFHLGVEYYQDLFLATVFEEDDGQIVKLNDKENLKAQADKRGISPRITGVPDDVKDKHNPLDNVSKKTGAGSSSQKNDWGAMSLYADYYTAAVPVILHHNAHIRGLKSRRRRWWDQMWYFEQLRELLILALNPAPLKPLTTVKIDAKTNDVSENGQDVSYYAPGSDAIRRKPRIYSDDMMNSVYGLREAEFDEVCRATKWSLLGDKKTWYDEVFRDGLGPIRK